MSYAKRKVITLKYKELLSELLSDFEIEIRSQIKENVILDGLSSGNAYEKKMRYAYFAKPNSNIYFLNYIDGKA